MARTILLRALLLCSCLGLIWASGLHSKPPVPAGGCTPGYVLLDDPVRLTIGSSELTFSILAVGCEESLSKAWPLDVKELEKKLSIELREPHPVQTLLLIHDRSLDLRRRVTRRVNEVLGKSVVEDVFLFEAKVLE